MHGGYFFGSQFHVDIFLLLLDTLVCMILHYEIVSALFCGVHCAVCLMNFNFLVNVLDNHYKWKNGF